MDLIRRASHADLEIRGDGRTVVGIAVPYDTPTFIRDSSGTYSEVFRRGAFAKTIKERTSKVKFLAQHERRSMPLGRAVLLREDAAGLYGEFRVSKTQAGEEALELIRDGALDGLSIGFRPMRDRWNDDRSFVERVESSLDEVSAVTFPAYADAAIAGVRASDLFGASAQELLAAIADDPDLADKARSIFTATSTPSAAIDDGTRGEDAGDPTPADAAPGHLGMSPEARARDLELLDITGVPS